MTVSPGQASVWESDKCVPGSVAALQGSRFQIPSKFSWCSSPRKQRKCPPSLYRLTAPPATGDFLNRPWQVPNTPAKHNSEKEGRAAQSRDIRSARHKTDIWASEAPPSGLGGALPRRTSHRFPRARQGQSLIMLVSKNLQKGPNWYTK